SNQFRFAPFFVSPQIAAKPANCIGLRLLYGAPSLRGILDFEPLSECLHVSKSSRGRIPHGPQYVSGRSHLWSNERSFVSPLIFKFKPPTVRLGQLLKYLSFFSRP